MAEDSGVLVKQSMTKLKKMGFFIKEVQRMSLPGMLALTRRTTADLKLSNGEILPKGTHLSFSNTGVSRDLLKLAA
jgi:hypothetical protein